MIFVCISKPYDKPKKPKRFHRGCKSTLSLQHKANEEELLTDLYCFFRPKIMRKYRNYKVRLTKSFELRIVSKWKLERLNPLGTPSFPLFSISIKLNKPPF